MPFYSVISSSGATKGILGTIGLIINAPNVAMDYANTISNYAFAGILLIALDLLVTVAFIAGLTRGLNAISGALGTTPFW